MPEKGDKAPDFQLQDTNGDYVTLDGLLSKGKAVLLFFPLAFTSTCTEELCITRDNMKLYNSLDAQVAGISVDSFFVLKEFKKVHNLNFKLLSDFNREAASRYGVLYEDYYGMHGVAMRASFVIGDDGSILHREILEDAGQLPDFDSITKALR